MKIVDGQGARIQTIWNCTTKFAAGSGYWNFCKRAVNNASGSRSAEQNAISW
jgi:hypothetical protein